MECGIQHQTEEIHTIVSTYAIDQCLFNEATVVTLLL